MDIRISEEKKLKLLQFSIADRLFEKDKRRAIKKNQDKSLWKQTRINPETKKEYDAPTFIDISDMEFKKVPDDILDEYLDEAAVLITAIYNNMPPNRCLTSRLLDKLVNCVYSYWLKKNNWADGKNYVGMPQDKFAEIQKSNIRVNVNIAWEECFKVEEVDDRETYLYAVYGEMLY